MAKPESIHGYNEQVTRDCERVLVTLLRNLGPWKDSIFLVGGLTPRYLVPDRPPVVPPHAGTLDIDIVLDVLILETTDAYRTLEENLRKIGFDNATNPSGRSRTGAGKSRWMMGAPSSWSCLPTVPIRSGLACSLCLPMATSPP
jgi:hypothetical protein